MSSDTSPLLGQPDGRSPYGTTNPTSTDSINPTDHTGTSRSPTTDDDELTKDELIEYERGVITWRNARKWQFWLRTEWIWGYIICIILIVIIALMSFFHHRIIDWLMPYVQKVRHVKYGFFVPISLIFVLGFPPLFGNEIVVILCGIVWGLGFGSAIVAGAMVLGECAVYAMFKYLCRGRAERMTKQDLNYACLSEAVKQGGFPMAWAVRLSVLPTQFTTAMFAICGLKFYHFFFALVLGLPKQLIAVYVGVVISQERPSTSSRVISNSVFAVTGLITVAVLRFIYRRMIAVRKPVLLSMRRDLVSKGVSIPDDGVGTRMGDVEGDSLDNHNVV